MYKPVHYDTNHWLRTASVSPPTSVQRGQFSYRASKVNYGRCWEKHKEREQQPNPFLVSQDLGQCWGKDKGPALSEPQCRRPCCLPLFCSSKCVLFFTSNSTASSLLVILVATLLAHDITGIPQCQCRGEDACVGGWQKTTHFLSLKGSRRNSGVPPRQSGRWTGSLCIVGHTLTKLPQSVLSLWRETLHPQASRGTAGACGCVHARTGRAEMTPRRRLVAQTLHCVASKPSLLPPLPTMSDVPSRGRHSWWSLGPLKDHRAEPCNYMHKDNQINNWWTNAVLWIAVACSLQVLVYFMLFFFLFFLI